MRALASSQEEPASDALKLGWVGLEPTTNALKGRCSTIELPTRDPKSSPQFVPIQNQPRKPFGAAPALSYQLWENGLEQYS